MRSLILEAEGHVVGADEPVPVQANRELIGLTAPAPHFNGYKPFENYFKFVFVRNPWARLVSCYQDKVIRPRPAIFRRFAVMYPECPFDQMSFAEFVRFVCRVPNELCDAHFKPQLAFFDPEMMDFIGRMERFSDDLAHILDLIGANNNLYKWCKIKCNQSSNGPHYIDFYNEQTRRLIAAKYRADIETFSYRFGE